MTPKEREACLQQMRQGYQPRLASETPEEREACLQQVRKGNQQRLANETPEETETHLQQVRLVVWEKAVNTLNIGSSYNIPNLTVCAYNDTT